ncbi:MAG: hypothetical protein JO223_23465 [Hyphomicrobiales bacterium]|nr:hypothetical protein [Hyphomicrobiales bacterium]MBV8440683.1 hypothetical protein [Hyphomicrobiales bacterium]
MLVANDGSPGGERALKYALELAKRLDLGVTVLGDSIPLAMASAIRAPARREIICYRRSPPR